MRIHSGIRIVILGIGLSTWDFFLALPLTEAQSASSAECVSKMESPIPSEELEAGMKLIADIRQERQRTEQLLHELFLILEDCTWLTALRLHEDTVTIEGFSLRTQEISDYCRNFTISEFFDTKELDERLNLSMSQYHTRQGEEGRTFTITVALEPLPPIVRPSPVFDNYACYAAWQLHTHFLQPAQRSEVPEQFRQLLEQAGLQSVNVRQGDIVQHSSYTEIPFHIQARGRYHHAILFAEAIGNMTFLTVLRELEIVSYEERSEHNIQSTVSIFLSPYNTSQSRSELPAGCRGVFQADKRCLQKLSAQPSLPLLQQYDLDDLYVVNIMTQKGGRAYAQIKTPSNQARTVTIGTRIGTQYGEVVSITETSVVVKERILDENDLAIGVEKELFLVTDE